MDNSILYEDSKEKQEINEFNKEFLFHGKNYKFIEEIEKQSSVHPSISQSIDEYQTKSPKYSEESMEVNNIFQEKKSKSKSTFFCKNDDRKRRVSKKQTVKKVISATKFLNVYRKLIVISRKLRDQLRFKNINYANLNHFRVLNDKAQIFSNTKEEKIRLGNECISGKKNIYKYILFFLNFLSNSHIYLLKMLPIIHPGQKIKLFFDLLKVIGDVILLVLYPLQVSFNISIISSNEIAIMIQKSINIYLIAIFSIGILIKSTTSIYKKGKLITNRTEILQNYMKKDLIIDLLFLIQLIFADEIPFLMILKILVLFRFKEIMKFVRMIFDFLHLSNAGIAFFQLLQLTFCIFFFSHCMACSWHAISYYGSSKDNILKALDIFNESWETRYFKYLFLTVNPGKIDPRNNIELTFGYFALLATSGSIGFMISGIHNIMRALSKSDEAKRSSIRKITDFMICKNIEFDLQNKVRQYINGLYDNDFDAQEAETNVINKLDFSLKGELLFKVNGKLLMSTPIFNKFSIKTIRKMVYVMKKVNFHPNDIIFQKGVKDNCSIYFIDDGEISIYSDEESKQSFIQFGKGEFFGELSFLLDQARTHSAISNGISSLYCISREDFLNVLKDNKNEYDNFCFIKDEIRHNQNYEPSEFKCYLCQNKGHVLENCKHIHLILDRGKVAAKHYFSASSNAREAFQRKRTKKFNSKCILRKLNFSIHAYTQFATNIFTNNEDMYEKEDDDDLYENTEYQGSKNQEFELNETTSTSSLRPTMAKGSTQRHQHYQNGHSVHSLTMMMMEKKIKENTVENIMKDFETVKNYEFYYPKWNIDVVLNRFQEQMKKRAKILKKRTKRTNPTIETHKI